MVVLQKPRKVGVARAYLRESALCHVGTVRRHILFPVAVILVFHHQADGAAQRTAIAHARQDLRFVRFDLLARAPAVAALPKGEPGVDLFRIDFEIGRQSFENGDERAPVRFSRLLSV